MPRPRTPATPPTATARVALNRSKREAAGARRISVMLSAEGVEALHTVGEQYPGASMTAIVEEALWLAAKYLAPSVVEPPSPALLPVSNDA